LVKLIDSGDFLETAGTIFVTHSGEKSLMVSDWKVLSKAIAPIPNAWYGLKDEDERYRHRYLDILLNPEIKDIFYKKAKFWEVTRDFMKRHGFLEVETPTLETTTGGAEANPFRTHHDDFDLDVFLRISVGELWQKRLMAAGFEKVFEIGRVYRNEGSSPDHLQEFTNMEFYWAYANYEMGMKLTQELYQEIALKVFGRTKFSTKGTEYDLAGDWPKLDYRETVLEKTGIDILKASEEEIKSKLDELQVKYEGNNRERLMDTLWKYCRKSMAGPVFLVNHPKLVSPLSKAKPENPELTERFQIIIAGSEVGNGFSELNDPIDQRQRFELQQKLIDRGDKEAMMPDWEFVEMLEHGMPPTCGFGFGERLFAFMVDKPVRETTLFPLMRPKREEMEKKDSPLKKNK
ncbi:MAG TPA: lysine--tRNA ligase, partial [bacterium]|nr:lysine--tRNA ligase [bacterium]